MTDATEIHPDKPGRHRWNDHLRDRFKTEKVCTNPLCQLVKVTRHEPNSNPPHWLEFFCDGERIKCDRTPACPYPPVSLRSVNEEQQQNTTTRT